MNLLCAVFYFLFLLFIFSGSMGICLHVREQNASSKINNTNRFVLTVRHKSAVFVQKRPAVLTDRRTQIILEVQ